MSAKDWHKVEAGDSPGWFRGWWEADLRRAGGDPDAIEALVGHDLGLRGVYTDPSSLPMREAVALIPPLASPAPFSHRWGYVAQDEMELCARAYLKRVRSADEATFILTLPVFATYAWSSGGLRRSARRSSPGLRGRLIHLVLAHDASDQDRSFNCSSSAQRFLAHLTSFFLRLKRASLFHFSNSASSRSCRRLELT